MGRRRRRQFLRGAALAGVAGIAGCQDRVVDEIAETPTPETDDDDNDSTPTPTPAASRERPFTLDLGHVVDITDDRVQFAMFVNGHDQESFTLNLHQTTPNNEWFIEPTTVPSRELRLDYDEEREQMVSSKAWAVNGNSELGDPVDSMEVPPHDDYQDFDDVAIGTYEMAPFGELGDPVPVFEFDIETPPTGRPIVFALTYEASGYSVPGQGRVQAWSPLIVRMPNGEYLHSYKSEPPENRDAFKRRWAEGSAQQLQFPQKYNLEWMRQTAIDELHPDDTLDDGVRVRVRRMSHYGKFSDVFNGSLRERAQDTLTERSNWEGPEHDTGYRLYPEVKVYEDLERYEYTRRVTPVNTPWAIEYEVSDEEVSQAEDQVSDYSDGLMVEKADDPAWRDTNAVQSVTSKLDAVCQSIGATEPTERLRVVADFVQGFQYESQWELLPPTYALANNIGDCTTYTLLLYSLLSQNEFSMSPTLGLIDEVYSTSDLSVGHTCIGVPFDDLEIDSFDERHYRVVPGELGEEDSFDGHLYVETTTTTSLGIKQSGWPETRPFDS